MKSSDIALKNRGFLSESEYNELKSTLCDDLGKYLHSSDAIVRTFSVRKIGETNGIAYINEICGLLKIENKLYTKIEICNYLANIGEPSIPYLIPLLGRIGNNQHKEIGNFDLGKKSFPLPRDIVARILIRIGPIVFQYLEPQFLNQNIQQLSEAIDVVGHIPSTSGDSSMENILFGLIGQDCQDLIRWKLIRSFQAFDTTRVIEALEKILSNQNENSIMRNEAKRSLGRIRMKKSA
jgi:hypothetical protein